MESPQLSIILINLRNRPQWGGEGYPRNPIQAWVRTKSTSSLSVAGTLAQLQEVAFVAILSY